MSRTDHVRVACGCVEAARQQAARETRFTPELLIAEAQVHATLALVEQQRIANLIALSQAEDQSGIQSELAMQAVWTHGPANPAWQERYDREPRPTPDIAAALGINTDKETNE